MLAPPLPAIVLVPAVASLPPVGLLPPAVSLPPVALLPPMVSLPPVALLPALSDFPAVPGWLPPLPASNRSCGAGLPHAASKPQTKTKHPPIDPKRMTARVYPEMALC